MATVRRLTAVIMLMAHHTCKQSIFSIAFVKQRSAEYIVPGQHQAEHDKRMALKRTDATCWCCSLLQRTTHRPVYGL
jgi:hypothetical protein